MTPKTASLFDYIDNSKIENIFTENVQVLARWSHAIERHLIENEVQGRVHVGTQTMQRFVPLAERYQQIAQRADVNLFAQADGVPMPEGSADINWISLANGDPLRNEWFVVAMHTDYALALVAEEIDNSDSDERLFRGLRTTNADIVRKLGEQLRKVAAERSTSSTN